MTTLCVCGAPAGEHVAGGGCARTGCVRFELPGSGAARSAQDRLSRCSECHRRPAAGRGASREWSNHATDCSRHGQPPNMAENKRHVAKL